MAVLKLVLFIVFLVIQCKCTSALNILGIWPVPEKGHFSHGKILMRELARRGHHVDMVSHFPSEKRVDNFRDIGLNGSLSVDDVISDNSTGIRVCELLGTAQLQALLMTPKGFYDVIVIEPYSAPCYLALGRHLRAPIVGLVAAELRNVDLFYDSDGTFANQIPLVEKYFNIKINSMSALYADISMMLVDKDLKAIRPRNSGINDIEELHMNDTKEKLSLDVQKWLDNSTDGCVYFSFGSIAKIESLPGETLDIFYDVFERIAPVTVLMKIDNEEFLPPGLPENVKVASWLPQVPVLKHKNTKAFITLGGHLDIQEAIAYGVPMIAFPLFGDELANIQLSEREEIAVELDLWTLSGDQLMEGLSIVLNDTTYRDNIAAMSKVFLDTPINALDTAVYWVEYTAIHGTVRTSSKYSSDDDRLHAAAVTGFLTGLIAAFAIYSARTLIFFLWERLKTSIQNFVAKIKNKFLKKITADENAPLPMV